MKKIVFVCLTVFGSLSSAQVASAAAGDTITFVDTATSGGYSSSWRLTELTDGTYRADQDGAGRATGTAIISGDSLSIGWSTPDGAWKGQCNWDLRTGVGGHRYDKKPSFATQNSMPTTISSITRNGQRGIGIGNGNPPARMLIQTIRIEIEWERVVNGQVQSRTTVGYTEVYPDGHEYRGVVSTGDAGMRSQGWIQVNFTVTNR